MWAVAATSGFISPYWFTFKQAQAHGAAVRRGERGAPIVYYAPGASDAGGTATRADDPTASEQRRGALLRCYTVFNAAQIDGLPPSFSEAANPPRLDTDGVAEALARVPARIIAANAAFYRASTDTVHMPPPHAFLDTSRYYSTLAHELAHWTRHPSRLNRDFDSTRFGDAGYALEELVAELTAAFVGAELGLPVEHIEDHSSYIASWLEVLSDDPGAFLNAAAKAQVAADFLRPFFTPNASATEALV